MLKSLFLISLVFFSFSGKSQEYWFDDGKFTSSVYFRISSIAQKINNEVKNGNLSAYRNDSFNKLGPFDISILDSIKISGDIEVLYLDNHQPDSLNRSLKLYGISLLYEFKIGNTTLGLQNLFYVKVSDLEKVISYSDLKTITILSNLLFDANVSSDFNPDYWKDGIKSYNVQKIENNISSRWHSVLLTREYLEPLQNLLIKDIASYFDSYLGLEFDPTGYAVFMTTNEKLLNKFSGLYKNENLKIQFKYSEIAELLEKREIVSYVNPICPDFKIDSIIFTYAKFGHSQTIIIKPSAIGIKPWDDKEAVFMPKTVLFSLLPKWEVFLIEEFLK